MTETHSMTRGMLAMRELDDQAQYLESRQSKETGLSFFIQRGTGLAQCANYRIEDQGLSAATAIYSQHLGG
jgi:hypothetical protein